MCSYRRLVRRPVVINRSSSGSGLIATSLVVAAVVAAVVLGSSPSPFKNGREYK